MKIVLANGCFDPVHMGHMMHLTAARRLGTELIVSLSSDACAIKQKSANRLFLPERERADLLMQLRSVNSVVIVDGLIEALERIKPDILVKGSDYKKGLDPEHAEYCRQHGIEIAFTDTPKWSILEIADELRRR